MDPISPITSGGPLQGAAAAPTAPAISSDFETFLKMLAVQLENQDPLNPVDSADYAVQLATFSSVEQQVLTNELLGGLIAHQQVSGMTEFARWIGLEARAVAPANYDGSSAVELAPNPLTTADAAALVVFDASGTERARIDVAPTADPIFWNGDDGAGGQLPPGRYSFALENFAEGELIATDALETYGRVIEARNDNGRTILSFSGGLLVDASTVTGLREPPA